MFKYEILNSDIEEDRKFWECVLSVDVKEFQMYSVYIFDDLKYGRGIIHHAWKTLEQINSVGVINDPK